MSTRTVTTCDCCHKEKHFDPKVPDDFVRLQYSEFGEMHVCAGCIAKNMMKRLSRIADEKIRVALCRILVTHDSRVIEACANKVVEAIREAEDKRRPCMTGEPDDAVRRAMQPTINVVPNVEL